MALHFSKEEFSKRKILVFKLNLLSYLEIIKIDGYLKK